MLKQRITALERQAAKKFPEKKPAYVNPLWAVMKPSESFEAWLLDAARSEQHAKDIRRRLDAGIEFPIIDTEQL
jgi:hypothetical protein